MDKLTSSSAMNAMVRHQRLMVALSNALVRTWSGMTPVQMRFLLLAIAKARHTGLGFSMECPVLISCKEYCDAYPSSSRTSAYTQLRAGIVDSVLDLKTVTFWIDETGSERCSGICWSQYAEYSRGVISLVFSEPIKPFITGLSKCFTRFPIGWISMLSSAYAMRLAIGLLQFRSTGVLAIREPELRALLGVPMHGYRRADGLRDRVLRPSCDQLRVNGWTVTWQQDGEAHRFVFSVPKSCPQVGQEMDI